ncbi:SDR family oxidoreductase [Streptomyces sp. HF10]|uniref:SDR family oxidoreductase n=1 Tax=Streptomyces sp. HF10 TaxID=2692233 RepID=UPI001316780C|nr:sugar nucleotide-binding protein [Streptomyces sp. HF10]QHC32690.1 sugar nucleotide-binding protein [Streptomyces sp. HF10]
MTLLIIGGSGFLGGELVRRAVAAGHAVTATYGTHPGSLAGADRLPLDIRRPEQLASAMDRLRPTTVINTASRAADWATTAEGAIRVAVAARRLDARLVHVSSDAVFSGGRVHYDESALPDPVTPYGAAKAAAETAIRVLVPEAVVVRTSLIIGDGGSPHERLVRELAAGRRDGALFTDDVRCPVHVADLARALLELAFSEHSGVRHVAGPDALSRYELGLLIARRDGLDPATVPAGRRADSGVPGALDVRLDSRRTRSALRTQVRGARAFLTATPGSDPELLEPPREL